MKRSTYWWITIPGTLTLVALGHDNLLDSLNPLVFVGIWLATATAVFTAVFERAKAAGKNPWKWVFLSLIPLLMIRLGRFPDAVVPAPKPPKYVKTASASFASAVAIMITMGVIYNYAPTPDMLAEQVKDAVKDANRSMPKQINEVTTLTGERAEGTKMVYVYELTDKGTVPAQSNVAISVCQSDDMRKLLTMGARFGYEYRRAGTVLGGFDVVSCPSVADAKTKADANKVPVVDTTPNPVPAGFQDVGPLAYDYSIVGDRFIIHAKGLISINEHVAFNKFRDTWANLPTDKMKHAVLALDSDGGTALIR